MTARPISVEALAAQLAGDEPLALFDIRDPVEAERAHIPGATSLPRRRIEFRIGELVRDPATPIVVCGDADRRGELAAGTLCELGYANVQWLAGGVSAWRASGRALASGNNVPSKAFGEHVQHHDQVPTIDAATLQRWQAEGRNIAICDVRTPEEHRGGCIPSAVSVPSFDIALHAADLAAQHETVVLHCAGRTRSIIGTETLTEMGFGNVVALENGTMGWRLAGLALERGSERRRGAPTAASRGQAERAAARLAAQTGVRRIDGEALTDLLAQTGRNVYVFDVRSVAEHDAGHIPGCTALPGGQAVQRADDFIAVRSAPIVLIDEDEARASLAGSWLRRMGFPDVSVLAGGMQGWRRTGRTLATGRARSRPLGWDVAVAASPGIAVDACRQWLAANPDAVVLDVDGSAAFRKGHLPGAVWLPRGWLETRIADVAALDRPLLVSCVDGRQSTYAAATLRSIGYSQLRWLDGGKRAWSAAGLALDPSELSPQDDELLAPYQRGEQAMRDYIDWEKLLYGSDFKARPT